MQVEQRHEDAAAALWLDIVHKEREPEYAGNSDAWHKLYAETFARFEASLPPSAPVDRDALQWIALFADMRSQDDSKTFARVNRGALRTIAERANAALALPPSGIAEMVREMCAKECDERAAKFDDAPPSNAYHQGYKFAAEQIASAIRSLDLSNKGVG